MRVKQDHRKADQSEGMVAGRKGASYFTTVPRIIPTNAECVSSDAGTGDNTATGRPRCCMGPLNQLQRNMNEPFRRVMASETTIPPS